LVRLLYFGKICLFRFSVWILNKVYHKRVQDLAGGVAERANSYGYVTPKFPTDFYFEWICLPVLSTAQFIDTYRQWFTWQLMEVAKGLMIKVEDAGKIIDSGNNLSDVQLYLSNIIGFHYDKVVSNIIDRTRKLIWVTAGREIGYYICKVPTKLDELADYMIRRSLAIQELNFIALSAKKICRNYLKKSKISRYLGDEDNNRRYRHWITTKKNIYKKLMERGKRHSVRAQDLELDEIQGVLIEGLTFKYSTDPLIENHMIRLVKVSIGRRAYYTLIRTAYQGLVTTVTGYQPLSPAC